MTTVQIEPHRRQHVAAEIVQLVVDDLIPTEVALECLHTAGLARHLDDATAVGLIAAAAEAQTWRDRLRGDAMALWLLYEDNEMAKVRTREDLLGLADDKALSFDAELDEALRQLAVAA